MKTCPICEKIIAGPNKNQVKYCSRACFGISHRKRIIANCAYCGIEMETTASSIKRTGRVYCSKECGFSGRNILVSKALTGHPALKVNGKAQVKHLQNYLKNNKPHNYSDIGKDLICLYCGKMFDEHPYKIKEGKAKYCSLECWNAVRLNPNRPEFLRIRATKEYREWRQTVMIRDKYTCQDCLLTNRDGAYLNAHHINSFKKYPELRTDINNGITLCINCHHKRHATKGRMRGICLDCGGKCSQISKRCLSCENNRRKGLFPHEYRTRKISRS